MFLCFTNRTLRDFGLGKATTEAQIQEEVTELIQNLDRKSNRPIKIGDDFPLPVLSILWTMIQGERIDHGNPDFLRMMDQWYIFVHEFGTNVGQLAAANPWIMRLLERAGILKMHQIFSSFFPFLDPIIEQHRRTLDTDIKEARDFIDRFLLEMEVW